MTTIAVTLRDEHQRFIEAAIKSGRYVSEAEVVADALTELKAREELRQARLAELKTEIQIGLHQLDRGEGLEWDIEAIKTQGREILAAPSSPA